MVNMEITTMDIIDIDTALDMVDEIMNEEINITELGKLDSYTDIEGNVALNRTLPEIKKTFEEEMEEYYKNMIDPRPAVLKCGRDCKYCASFGVDCRRYDY
jgi:hypothetical protein